MGAVSATAGYGAAPRAKKYVSKWTHWFKHIIHIDDFTLNGHPPSSK